MTPAFDALVFSPATNIDEVTLNKAKPKSLA
jgi:hypothetical protein